MIEATKAMRARVLSVFHAVVALNAVGGGIYGLTGARDVPVEWLAHTPFSTYFIPSLILLVVVGGTHAAAAVSIVTRTPRSRFSSLAAGAILLGWIGVQVIMIGYVSWLQPAVAVLALANLTLAWNVADDGHATVSRRAE